MESAHYRRPVHGVHDRADRTTVVFVTVNTEYRRSWLACDEIHRLLCNIWTEATGWLVGPYMLMPEHMHFFAARGNLDGSLERWEHYWKRNFTLLLPHGHLRLQENHWDTRIRNSAHYSERLEYMRQNPVRRGLVAHPEDWPYQGTVHDWTYIGP